MLWNLSEGKTLLRPLQYTNGKSQLEIVNEINEEFDRNKFVLLCGICGTGKSPIALHCCANFGKSIIVVPTKHLQDQYYMDYSKKMKVHDLKIQFIKGRSNFKCRYENGKVDCNYPSLPCIAHLRSSEKRYETCKCGYWSPIYTPDVAQKLKAERESLGITDVEMRGYKSPSGLRFQVVQNPTCSYNKQFFSFWDETNVIVMNDRIWELMLFKKPETELEVIDEYDGMFDSLYFDEVLSLSRFKRFFPRDEDASGGNAELRELHQKKMNLARRIGELNIEGVWDFLGEVKEFFFDVLKEHDDAAIANFVDRLEVCLANRDECDIDFETKKTMMKEDEKLLHIIMPNPYIVIQKLFKNSKRVLLMSATPHSDPVLRNFFKVSPNVVMGESVQPGTLYLMKSDMKYVTYREWVNETFRNEYYEAYRKILKCIPKNEMTLIQSHSLKYSGVMAKEFNIPVDSAQEDFYGNSGVFNEWLNGDFKKIISTKCKRGVDLKDDLCRNIVIDKMPYPDKNDRKFKSIERRMPSMFNEIYNDIARRNLIQLIARGLRHKDDWIRVYTPDKVVYENIKKLNVFKIKEMKMNQDRREVQGSLK
jgi:hypothetical protein